MIQFFKKHDIVIKAVCVFVACFLWVYVVSTDSPDVEKDYKDVKITLQNQNKILDNYGLAIISGEDDTIDIRVKGSRERISQIGAKSNILVTADVSNITNAGTHQVVYTVTLPVDGVEIVSRTPAYITVVTDKIVTMTVPIKVNISGKVPDGYSLGDYTVSPENITIEGPDTIISNIAAARVDVDASTAGTDKTANWTKEYVFIDKNDKQIASDDISASTKTVTVSIPITKTKTIPITADILSAPGIDKSFASVAFYPSKITVTGDDGSLELLNQINAGTIDLAEVNDGDVIELPLILPNGVKAVDDTQKVSAQIKLTGITTAQFFVNDIRIENLDDNFTATPVTTDVTVTVIGAETDIAKLKPENIFITAEFSKDSVGSKIKAGEYTLAASVKITGGYNVAATGEYHITVKAESK